MTVRTKKGPYTGIQSFKDFLPKMLSSKDQGNLESLRAISLPKSHSSLALTFVLCVIKDNVIQQVCQAHQGWASLWKAAGLWGEVLVWHLLVKDLK